MNAQELLAEFRKQPPEVQEKGFSEWMRSNNHKVELHLPATPFQDFQKTGAAIGEIGKKMTKVLDKKGTDLQESFTFVAEHLVVPLKELAKTLQRWFDREKQKFDELYEEFEPLMETILKEKYGDMACLPKNSDEMLHVFLFDIIDPEKDGDLIRSLEREDFIRFHFLMRKKLLTRADEIESEYSDSEGSNAAKLSDAAHWMDPLMRNLTALTLPKNKEIKDLFDEVYPGLSVELDPGIKFAKGAKLHKGNIGKALKILFEKKHSPSTISVSAIYKRYWGKNKDKRD